MNNFSPPYPPGTAPAVQSRRSIDSSISSAVNGRKMQAERSGAVPMPVASNGTQRPFTSRQNEDVNMAPLAMARSPPKNKNTQHVPCKFFLQGQCQAGRMCPFSHDVESTTRPAPCKYFAKGGCKFGRKCALLHVAPDGTVVNRHPAFLSNQTFAPNAPVAAGGFGQPAPPGLLSMQAQGLEQRRSVDGALDYDSLQYGIRNAYDPPQFDMTYTSASPTYGSPPNDRIATSPPQKGLSVLDAPLPNSFDSNGISWAARNGPFAASVPSKFDFDSPPSSLPRKSQLGNSTLRDLHTSAFGERGMDNVLASMGSSPPSGTDEPLTFPKRPLHSEYLRASRPLVSASLGTRLPVTTFEYSDAEDDGGDTDREEDLLPASLRDLIPENRIRKDSRSRLEEDTPAAFLAAQRRTISSHGTPQDSKVGSPHSSSPSRYSGVFTRTQSARDAFGHVGSPLRGPSFPISASSFPRPSTNGELASPSISSPPRQASMSMLTQELQRTKLDAALSQAVGSTSIPPAPIRTTSNGSSSGARKSLDRGLSSTSVGQRIDEEQEVFDMDEEPKPMFISNGLSNNNNAWNNKSLLSSSRDAEPSFGAIGGHRASK